MYNTLFGINNMAILCLVSVGLNPMEIPRFRDAIFEERNKHYYVKVLTRTGGENRGYYDNRVLLENKNYMKDYDDKFDPTYRYFIFRVPKELYGDFNWKSIFKDQSRKELDIKKMFDEEIKEMEIPGTSSNKRAKQMARGLESIFNKTENDNNIHVITPEAIMKEGEKKLNKGDKHGRKK